MCQVEYDHSRINPRLRFETEMQFRMTPETRDTMVPVMTMMWLVQTPAHSGCSAPY
jgi:hypothetical protein